MPKSRRRPGSSPDGTSPTPSFRGMVALLVAAVVALLGLQAPAAQAAPQPHAGRTAPAAHVSPASSHVTPACGTPKPGTATCFALRRTDVPAVRGLTTAATPPAGYGADDLQSAYGLPANGGAGRTIAVVDAYDDPSAEADLAVYRAQYGLPACTSDDGCLTKVSERGGTDYPDPDGNWSGEISLDLDMVSAAAPLAHILLVEADSASPLDLAASVDEAVALGAGYVSNSYGTDYTSGSGETPDETAIDASYNHPGVAVVASSGDYAYGVAYPAASPYVTAVGGTSLIRDSGAERGWSESAWEGAGSGCSQYEPKPAFQSDTGCAHRSVADVSAVADPQTGVAVYQTYGASGWSEYGGTSVAAPIITGVYAAAGTPTPGTYPNAYPYRSGGAGLHDVTSGSNGTCTPSYLCTGGPGYDGPTGLGTPDGLVAFRDGPHGVVSGTVTDAATGAPLAGVAVEIGDSTAQTDSAGRYSQAVPVGTYDIDVATYGYASAAASGVTVGDGASVTRNFRLTKERTTTVSGTVTDGSGQGWPLYASVTVDGVPGGPVWTDPRTGAYRIELPEGHTYSLHVASAYSGYQAGTASVVLGRSGVRHDIALPADRWSGDTPGYTVKDSGTTEGFDSAASAPGGWSVVNAPGTSGGWEFDDPGSLGNNTGGNGAFAEVDSDLAGTGASQDSSLVSPAYDFTRDSGPELTFRTDYFSAYGQTATVDASTDDGTTWSTVWSASGFILGPSQVSVPLSAYAHDPRVRFRFHFTASYGWTWEVDDVFVGNRALQAVPGGLVAGTVTDANTGAPLDAAAVSAGSGSGAGTVTTATPNDPALTDGFYWLFAPAGTRSLTAVKSPYTTRSQKVKIASGRTETSDIALDAGKVTAKQTSVTAAAARGRHVTTSVTFTNSGGAPATVSLAERPGDSSGGQQGAPLSLARGTFSPGPSLSTAGAAAAGPPATPEQPSGSSWQAAPDLPVATTGNAVDVHDGTLYSADGFTTTPFAGFSNALYAYTPSAGTWTQLPSAANKREAPAHGFIGDKLYVTGGWSNILTTANPSLEIYDTTTGTWSFGANNPKPLAAPGSAVLDGKLYSVGGCTLTVCGSTTVTVYDPRTDSWSTAADYPEPTAWTSCGAILGRLYCAGGTTDDGPLKSAYVYNPATDSWSPLPDPPESLWGSATAVADGRLLVSSGIVGGQLSNQAFAYDPAADAWSTLPNVAHASYRGGGAPGFYKVGGEDNSELPVAGVEVLPGYDRPNAGNVPWLAEGTRRFTVEPGRSVRVTLTLDASVPETARPGTYTAELVVNTDTPYQARGVPVSFTVTGPRS